MTPPFTVHHRCVIVVALLAACTSPATGDAPVPSSRAMTVGVNLSNVNDWNREWVFVDVFKHSRPWIPQTPGGGGPWSTGQKIELTPEGWPLLKSGQAASTLMCRSQDGHYPRGRYIMTHEGTGRIAVGFDAGRMSRIGPNRYDVQVVPGVNGILLRIEASQHSDPVRNIRFTLPGYEEAEAPFHPLFLERLQPFKVLRFVGWQRIGKRGAVDWATRTTPASIRQSGPDGVALEYMVELCNTLDADPWFCMPHLADDGFVRSFATFVKHHLRDERTIYVEWSNEAWNSVFVQGRWVYQQAKARALHAPQVTADEARRDWRIWHEVFGADQHRVVRVAAGQLHNPWVAQTMLDRLDGEFDAVSCTAYFGVDDKLDERATAQDVVVSAMNGIERKTLPLIQKHAAMADRWQARLGRPILLLAYEAGQHIIPIRGFGGGRDQFVPWKQAAWDCQTHPKMYDAYMKLLRGCEAVGVDLFVALSYVGRQDKWGSWGHLRYQDEPLSDAPKFRALLSAATGVPTR